jgi:hypothetical protein
MDSVKATGDEALANAVFERLRADFAALKKEELQQVNLDIPAAVATVLGVLPEVRQLRDQIVKELPSFNIAQFDKLEDYAVALSFVQARFLAATQPPDDLAEVAEQATMFRERLLAEARALVHHKLVSEEQLAQLKGANGYKNVATDVMVLTGIMQEQWPQIQGKTPTTTEDLDQASRVATRLLRIVGLREQGPAQVAEVADLRLRAFTLLIRTYDDARRAVTYLRSDEDDVDSITPSLHPGRPRRRPTDAEQAPAGPVSPAPGTTAPGTAAAPAVAPSAAVPPPVAAAAKFTPLDNKGPFL